MKTAPIPDNESQRVAALERYGILDTPPEIAFDELTSLISQICATPIALITFIDRRRQWFKSRIGWDVNETPRELSFCGHAILQSSAFEVQDLSADGRFADNPFVAGASKLRFYASMPLITAEGYALGTLCVMDREARRLKPEQLDSLRILSRQVMTQLELRRHLVDLARSIEEHKETEDRLRNSEAFYQTLVDTLPQNILRKDIQGRFTFANKKFCHSVGKPLNDILGKTDFDFFPREMALKYQRDDARVMTTLENLDTIEAHVTPSGERLFVHVLKTPLYDALGRVIGIQGIFWDVTQRKKTEEALAYERDLLRALLDNIPDRIYFKDVESRFIRCSASMVKRLGVTDQSEVIGKTDFDFHPRELAQEFYQDEQTIILTGKPLISKLERQIDMDGNPIWASVTKVPIYNQNGSVTGIIGISRDMTELKKAESALEQARDEAVESARVKSQFLANMSHEIRTPMYAITGMTGLLMDTRLTQEQREYASTIRDSTETLLQIINDILDFSKVEAGKLTFEIIDFDLREAVESTVEMLAENAQKKGIELNSWIRAEVPCRLRGDPGRFRQVLANLLSNAVKFTEKGEVLVSISCVSETESEVVVLFEVSDTGVGIPREAMPLIFQPFTQADGSTTRKYGGTGLGLTISKQLVEMMHGEMGVNSSAGKGSVFWFKLPFEKQAFSDPFGSEPPAELAGVSVLIVEPHETSRRILCDALEIARMKVLSVRTAKQALDFLREAAGRTDPFQVAIVDISTPDFEDLALMHAIKADSQLASLRTVVLNALGNRLDPAMMQGARISSCMTKPVRVSRLYDCLVRVLSGQGDDTKFFPSEAFREVLPYYAAAKRNIRILVAEDNTVNQRLTLRQLKKLGYNADAVANGREVLESLQRVPYDIILMDCQMPELDGYETARQIRQGSGSVSPYIIALTANALLGDRNKCLGAGMNDYLPKPLDLPGLEGVLQRALLKIQRQVRTEDWEMDACLDPAVIAGLKELRQANEPDPLKELAELFVKDSRPRLVRMDKAAADRDRMALASAAHTLKGSANNLGARHLAGLCARVEKAATEEDFREAANILLEVKSEFQRVERALKAELEKPENL